MNRTALHERIKEEMVLRRGQVKERQWRQTGLPDEAAREGIAPEEFRRMVNEVGRQINFEKLADLRRRMEDALNAPPLFELHQTQQDDFVAEAERMGLTPTFVRERWLPGIIADLKKTTPPAPPVAPETPPSTPPVQAAQVPPAQAETSPVVAPIPPRVTPEPPSATPPLRERVKTILDEYQGHISARDLRLLFRAMHTDERVLAEEILAYFSANFYASETEPTGSTLAEKLLSTDWRHLSFWDKPVQPGSTPVMEPVTASAPPTPEPAPAPAYVPPVPPSPQPERSNAGLWGAVFAVAVLLILYLLVKPSQKKPQRNDSPTNRTEKTTDTRSRSRSERAPDPEPTRRKEPTPTNAESDETVATDDRSEESTRTSEPTATPAQTEEKPTVDPTTKPAKKYDRLLDAVGQFGEQPARLGRRWGLWRGNDWMIYPIYDDITTFKDGRATVVRNGKTYDIDENGNPIE